MNSVPQFTSLGAYGGPTAFYGDSLMNDMEFVLKLAGALPTDFNTVFPAMACRVADEGVRVIVQVVDSAGNPVNIRNADKKLIKLMKPSSVTCDIVASLLTNGYDGRMYFSSTELKPPFDQAGVWFIQAEIAIDSVQQSTKWGCFTVQPNITAN